MRSGRNPLAAALGAAIGLEREYRHSAAGLRTNMLIALGSGLFSILSVELGAGTILRNGGSVRGLTTAATIWVNAAIGVAAGVGLFALATCSTVTTVAVLAVLAVMERLCERGARRDVLKR